MPRNRGPLLFIPVLLNGMCMLVGTRYLFVGKLYERRPSYHLLGVLLFVQLGISAGTWALSNATEVQRSNTDMPASTTKALKAAIVLQVSQPCRSPAPPAFRLHHMKRSISEILTLSPL